jgi:hypothetical protein
MTWALPQLTGGAFQSFSSVTMDSPLAGASVTTLTPGVITFARFVDVQVGVGSPGNTFFEGSQDSSVLDSVIMIDETFEQLNPALTRSLRSHELGHALGYNELSDPPSVMDPDRFLLPTEFDRTATSVVFQRPSGNRSPDTDPATFTVNTSSIRQ